MRLVYAIVPEKLSGFGYYFVQFLVLFFNLNLIISNNYSILFICLVVIPIFLYFNKLDKSISVFIAYVFIARWLTYENQNYDNEIIKQPEDNLKK